MEVAPAWQHPVQRQDVVKKVLRHCDAWHFPPEELWRVGASMPGQSRFERGGQYEYNAIH